MNRRIGTQIGLWAALADAGASGYPDLMDCLLLVLADNMLPRARTLVGPGAAEPLAAVAALIGVERVQGGRMYRDTARYEADVLLPDALRRQGRLFARATDRARARSRHTPIVTRWRDWPGWLSAVYAHLVLTRRAWVYLSLYTARRPRHGWHGELGRIYLGDRKRQPALTRAKAPLLAVVDQLNAVLVELLSPAADPATADWFGPLHDADPGPGAVREALRRSAPPFPTADYPDVAAAIAMLGGSPALALAAYEELALGLTGQPFPADGALADWLTALPGSHSATERAPRDVLAAILAAEPYQTPVKARAASAAEVPLVGEELYAALTAAGPREAFETAVIHAAFGECRRDIVLQGLCLPAADDVDPATRAALAVRLEHWRRYAVQSAARESPAEREKYLWVEMPRDVRQAPGVLAEAVARALGTAGGRWADGAAGLAVLGGLLAITLDGLGDELVEMHQNDTVAAVAAETAGVT